MRLEYGGPSPSLPEPSRDSICCTWRTWGLDEAEHLSWANWSAASALWDARI